MTSRTGCVLLAGATDFEVIGRKTNDPQTPNLAGFHRLKCFEAGNVKEIVTSAASAHDIFILDDGSVYGLGRNESCQLGKKSAEKALNCPFKLDISERIKKAATGRAHTLLLSESGSVFAAGDNKNGSCGANPDKVKVVEKFTVLPGFEETIKDVACGADFSALLSEEGQVYIFGSTQYGVLGDGKNREYIATGNKLLSAPIYTPYLVEALKDFKVKKVACGTNHVAVLTEDGAVYSWGFNGFGRLGLGDAKDYYKPQKIAFFQGQHYSATDLACGPTASLANTRVNAFYMWGKFKNTGDGSSGQPWTYPKPYNDLSGWKVADFSAGAFQTFFIADDSVICFGQGCVNGELGLGDDGPKSASRAEKVNYLDKKGVFRVACGNGHTLLLADHEKCIKDLPVWDAQPATPKGKTTKKRKGEEEEAPKPKAAKATKKATKK